MVPITRVNGVYKPSYNWGGPHCMLTSFCAELPQDLTFHGYGACLYLDVQVTDDWEFDL